MPIFKSLRLCCWTATLADFVLGLLCVGVRVRFGNGGIRAASWSTLTPTHSKPRTESANVVVQQHSRKLLKMGILMPQTCWVSKKKNKNIKWHLVGFYSSSSTDISLTHMTGNTWCNCGTGWSEMSRFLSHSMPYLMRCKEEQAFKRMGTWSHSVLGRIWNLNPSISEGLMLS